MRSLLAPFRFVSMLFLVLGFLVTMSVVFLLVRGHWARVRWSNRILRHFCRLGLKLLDVHVTYRGLERLSEGASLFVCNHLSYLDVLVLHARVPACFVTSREIRETPVLGQICALAGCLFVERRRLTSLRGEVGEIAEGLKRGFNVAIFPEATSGNGERMIKFKRPLFRAAVEGGRPVQPFCLNYHTVGGRPIDQVSRDSVFWYGDMDFAPHLWALCRSGGLEVDVEILPPIATDRNSDVSGLAEEAQAAIEGVFRPVR